MSPRLKLTVAYDGAAFAGWQSQAHGNTAQDQLERAVHKISGQRVRVHGAGRTDTGVHALAMRPRRSPGSASVGRTFSTRAERDFATFDSSLGLPMCA